MKWYLYPIQVIGFIVGCLYVLTVYAFGCPSGSEPWKDGVCVADISPEQAPSNCLGGKPGEPIPDKAVPCLEQSWVSDEKPPRSGMPSWQNPNVHVLELPSLAADDANQDKARDQADVQGKKRAGLK